MSEPPPPPPIPEILREREPPKPRPDARVRKSRGRGMSAWGVGLDFGYMVAAGALLGFGVDAFFGTKPWGILVGSLIGLAGGFTQFIRQALKLNRAQSGQSRKK